jgi:transposase
MGYITGLARNQMVLFPESIDEYIDEDNPSRVIDAYVNSLELSDLGFTKATPSDTGRPPYCPYEMLKLYIYGYMNRIRSSRRLETETKRNIEVMWLMEKLSPDHKTIARFLKENAAALKAVFRDFVKLCLKLDLYGRELSAIDGSKFKAVYSTDRNLSKTELSERINRLNTRIDEYMRQLNETDATEDNRCERMVEADIRQIVERLSTRKSIYNGYLEELTENEETQKSLTDPDARLMKDAKGFDVSYNVQISVDSKNKLIAEFNVTNDVNDMKQLTEMATKTAEILESPNITAAADTGYNNASEMAKCIEAGIIPEVAGSEGTLCIPCEAHEAEEIISHENGKAVYIKERNIAICPMGNILYPKHYKNSGRTAIYYNYNACSNCSCRCTSVKYRTFAVRMKKAEFRKEYNADDLCIKQIHIKPNPEIISRRKELAEHPFGTVKRAMDAGYLLTKGLKMVAGELSLVFLAFNMKRVINIIGTKKLIEAMI